MFNKKSNPNYKDLLARLKLLEEQHNMFLEADRDIRLKKLEEKVSALEQESAFYQGALIAVRAELAKLQKTHQEK